MNEDGLGTVEEVVPVPRRYNPSVLDEAIDHVSKYVLDDLEIGANEAWQPSESWRAGFVAAHLRVRLALDRAYAEVQQ